MKINAINNTNFKGLFTNKSSQNGGNWRMEYSPYAWESKNGWTIDSKMARQCDIDVFGTCLPNNEKIYTEKNGRKSAKDILGTEFYYEYDNGKVRKTITEVPAMNREDSLKVYNQKLNKFLEMKKEKAESMENAVANATKNLDDDAEMFYSRADDLKNSYFGRSYTTKDSSRMMENKFNKVKDSLEDVTKQFKDYAHLRDSSDRVKQYIYDNEKEISLLSEKRKAGKLIDISRRDIYDPNKALWSALQNIKEAAEKYVSLPHKTISVQEILKAVGTKAKKVDIPKLAIQYVDSLIQKRI